MADQIFNVNCGFFNSVNGDRKYNAEDMTRPYKNIISNGVFATPEGTPSNKLQVLSDEGMNIIVKAGDGIFADKWFESPADLSIEVPSNPNIVARRDSVIVQIDKTQQGRVGNIVYRTGVAASDPVPPTINENENENIIEYRIANIYVTPNVTEIGQDVITDLRGSEECLWVTSLIHQVDTSTLYKQWYEAYQKYYDEETKLFNDFMHGLTEQLTVYTSVIIYESNFVTIEDGTTEIPINIPTFNKNKDVLMVKINHLGCSSLNDYTISDDSSKITLTKPLSKDQSVDFLVLKSVVVGDAETVLSEVQKLASSISLMNNEIKNIVPIGSGMDYYGTTAPENYMFADGSAISRTAYAELFAIIGETYGAGDGSTTFNLPDKRSRVSVMKDSGTFNELGKKGGEETHQLTEAELPEVSGTASGVATYQSWATGKFTATKEGTGELSGSAGVRHWTSLLFKFGQNKAHNNLQPYLVCNYIIKVK